MHRIFRKILVEVVGKFGYLKGLMEGLFMAQKEVRQLRKEGLNEEEIKQRLIHDGKLWTEEECEKQKKYHQALKTLFIEGEDIS